MSAHGSPHGPLSAKRRKVRKQSQAIAKTLKASGTSGSASGVTSDLKQLRSTLATLRTSVQHEGGPSAQHVAAALGHLDTSLGKLIEAQNTNGNEALTQLAFGVNALNAARAAAKAAGNAWQL
jgi:hypothetical protein